MRNFLVMVATCNITVRVQGYWMYALMSDFKVGSTASAKSRNFAHE